ncbi:MrpH family fimbial adhesin, partial [Serratia marcescens]|uniref:MrpH family fimbial adhesin n=1 Tax=Serratia marcescens TaxID=615 RepID=UPI001CA5822E
IVGGALLLLSMPSFGAINISNVKWEKYQEDRYILSFTPTGTAELIQSVANFKCNGVGATVGGQCFTTWTIRVDGQLHNCDNVVSDGLVSVNPGTSLRDNTTRVNRSVLINQACIVSSTRYIKFKGDEKICVMLAATGPWDGPSSSLGGSYVYLKSGECPIDGEVGEVVPPILPPVKPASCTLSSSTAIKHGAINYNSVQGNEARATAYLSCTSSAAVNISVNNGGVVDLDSTGALRSTIYVSGKQGGNTFSNVTGTDVEFKSVLSLKNNGVISGDFEKTTVVTVNIL